MSVHMFRYSDSAPAVRRFALAVLFFVIALCLFGCSNSDTSAVFDETECRARIESFGNPALLDDDNLKSMAELYEALRNADLLTESDYEALATVYGLLGDVVSECSARYDLYMLFPTEEHAAQISALVVPADASALDLLDRVNGVLEQLIKANDTAQTQDVSLSESLSSNDSASTVTGDGASASSSYTSLIEIVVSPEWNTKFRLGSGVVAKTTSAKTAAGDWRIKQDDAATSLTRISDDLMTAFVLVPEKGMQLFTAEVRDGKPHGAFVLNELSPDGAQVFQLTGTIDGAVMIGAITVIRNGVTYSGTIDSSGHITTPQDGGGTRLIYARSGDNYLYTNAGTQADFVMDLEYWGVPMLGLEGLSQ